MFASSAAVSSDIAIYMQAYIRPFDFVSGQVILSSAGEISKGIAVGRSTAVATTTKQTLGMVFQTRIKGLPS